MSMCKTKSCGARWEIGAREPNHPRMTALFRAHRLAWRAGSSQSVARIGWSTQNHPYLRPHPENNMRTFSLAMIALTLPVTLAAQQQPTANPITTAIRNRTLFMQRNIAQAFDSIPEAKFGYKPTP